MAPHQCGRNRLQAINELRLCHAPEKKLKVDGRLVLILYPLTQRAGPSFPCARRQMMHSFLLLTLARVLTIVAAFAHFATPVVASVIGGSPLSPAHVLCSAPGQTLSAESLERGQELAELFDDAQSEEERSPHHCDLCMLAGAAVLASAQALPSARIAAELEVLSSTHDASPRPARGPPLGATGPPLRPLHSS